MATRGQRSSGLAAGGVAAAPAPDPRAAPSGASRDAAGALGLYLHIPFCAAICSYCNFNRGLLDAAVKARYVAALEAEVRSAAAPIAVDSIYFGGGTPSLLEPAEVAALIRACDASFKLSSDSEVTLEVNPETVTQERLAGYRGAGVNRFSIGIQSFDDGELRRIGRAHTAARAGEVCGWARAAGVENFSVDLMLGLPEQTWASWRHSVERLIAATPQHASLYLLELYPGAPLASDLMRHGWSMVADDALADMYLWAFDRLDRVGLRQYEISNAARPGRRARHNLKYWMDGEWLGFGCGAHSTRQGQRWKNVAGTEPYIARVTAGLEPVSERRVLGADEHLGDALFSRLRLVDGVDLEATRQRYGVDVWDRYGAPLGRFVDAGLVAVGPSHFRLTRAGMLVANEVMSVFV